MLNINNMRSYVCDSLGSLCRALHVLAVTPWVDIPYSISHKSQRSQTPAGSLSFVNTELMCGR